MRTKLLLATALAAATAVAAATAAPPPGKGKPPATGTGCKPRVSVVLKGALAAEPGAAPAALSVTVRSSNRHGRAYVAAAQPRSIAVTAETKVRRRGQKTLAALEAGDRVLVQSRVCKADLANSATPALTATRVIAHPAS
jgi:hypothetical protein